MPLFPFLLLYLSFALLLEGKTKSFFAFLSGKNEEREGRREYEGRVGNRTHGLKTNPKIIFLKRPVTRNKRPVARNKRQAVQSKVLKGGA